MNYKKLFVILFFIAFPFLVQAINLENAGPFLMSAEKTSGYEDYPLVLLIGSIIQIVLSFIGVIFLVLMLYGGFLWMTARGNEEQVTKAKSLFMSAVIGLVIVISAYAISYFVVKVIGGPVLDTAFLINFLV